MSLCFFLLSIKELVFFCPLRDYSTVLTNQTIVLKRQTKTKLCLNKVCRPRTPEAALKQHEIKLQFGGQRSGWGRNSSPLNQSSTILICRPRGWAPRGSSGTQTKGSLLLLSGCYGDKRTIIQSNKNFFLALHARCNWCDHDDEFHTSIPQTFLSQHVGWKDSRLIPAFPPEGCWQSNQTSKVHRIHLMEPSTEEPEDILTGANHLMHLHPGSLLYFWNLMLAQSEL